MRVQAGGMGGSRPPAPPSTHRGPPAAAAKAKAETADGGALVPNRDRYHVFDLVGPGSVWAIAGGPVGGVRRSCVGGIASTAGGPQRAPPPFQDGCELLVASTADGRLDLGDAYVMDWESGQYARPAVVGDVPPGPRALTCVPWEDRFLADTLYKKRGYTKARKKREGEGVVVWSGRFVRGCPCTPPSPPTHHRPRASIPPTHPPTAKCLNPDRLRASIPPAHPRPRASNPPAHPQIKRVYLIPTLPGSNVLDFQVVVSFDAATRSLAREVVAREAPADANPTTLTLRIRCVGVGWAG